MMVFAQNKRFPHKKCLVLPQLSKHVVLHYIAKQDLGITLLYFPPGGGGSCIKSTGMLVRNFEKRW